MSFTRAAIQRVPARFVYNPTGTNISFYAKEGTVIQQDLVYEKTDVGAAGLGLTDARDKEMYYRVHFAPDGRLTGSSSAGTGIAGALFPYANATMGAGIFTDTDITAQIHGNDTTGNYSLDTYTSVALEKMPEMYFHPEKTLLGPCTWLAIRGSGDDWSATSSLVAQADTGGTFVDSGFTTAGLVTQNYTVTWGTVAGFSVTDFYDGLTFQPAVTFVDDEPARYGLYNKRIKTVGGILRGIPLIGTTARQSILAALYAQGTGAARGGSRAANGATLTITGTDTNTPLILYGAALMDQKQAWGIENLRQGEVAWMCTPTLTAGVRGPYFAVGAA
jgi:hypothetical protein